MADSHEDLIANFVALTQAEPAVVSLLRPY